MTAPSVPSNCLNSAFTEILYPVGKDALQEEHIKLQWYNLPNTHHAHQTSGGPRQQFVLQ